MSPTSSPVQRVLRLFRESPRLASLVSAEGAGGLLQRGILRPYQAGGIVLSEHVGQGRIHLVLSGTIQALGGGDGTESVLETFVQGCILGYFSDFLHFQRGVKAVARAPSLLLEIPGELTNAVFEENPLLLDTFLARYRERIIWNSLQAVPVFRGLPSSALTHLADQARIEIFPGGRTIIGAGEPGEAFHVVSHGLALVHLNAGDKRMNLALLRPGDYFGEWSLLTGAPRAANVSALTLCCVLRVEAEVFLDFIQQNPTVREGIDLVAHRRRSEAVEYVRSLESDSAINQRLSQISDVLL